MNVTEYLQNVSDQKRGRFQLHLMHFIRLRSEKVYLVPFYYAISSNRQNWQVLYKHFFQIRRKMKKPSLKCMKLSTCLTF